MRLSSRATTAFSLLLALAGCDAPPPEPLDGGVDAGAADPNFVARCDYTNTFADNAECKEYRGVGWGMAQVDSDCARVFLGRPGTLVVGEACDYDDAIGRCTVGDPSADGHVLVSRGGAAACGAAQSGCETFAGGTFEPSPSCNTCAATGEIEAPPFTPWFTDCRPPLAGEPPGATNGEVCTPVIISGSTEPGRRYADYADCDVVRTQRPYYAEDAGVTPDPADPRLQDDAYLAEVEWMREQAESSACTCCHSASETPSGAAIWDTEAGALWTDTISDEALAMMAGLTPSGAFGYLPASENNTFDRSATGLPTTDSARLEAFVEMELGRRGVTLEQARELDPFAPFFQELIDFTPEACAEGLGVDSDGMLRWTGGPARQVTVLAADSASPGVPPNWDLPEGTIWALFSDPTEPAMGCGMAFGDVPAGANQTFPESGAPTALTSGQTYYLHVQRDIAQPITRCLFVAP